MPKSCLNLKILAITLPSVTLGSRDL